MTQEMAGSEGQLVAQDPTFTAIARAEAAGHGLQEFEQLMLEMVHSWGLPTNNIVAEVPERKRLLRNIPEVLSVLDDQQRDQSSYISKMILAASVGLFDAALSYLWNETMTQLRQRVASFDIQYFFDLAESDPERRKQLETADDLSKITDAALLEASQRVQLISDVGFRQLDTIRFMRNKASAAHPTTIPLTGLKLAEWLETCIREVITLPRDYVVAQIGQLLHNVRTQRLTEADVAQAAGRFRGLMIDQADNLAAGLFGIYTSPKTTPEALDNVRELWPSLWPEVSEAARNECGVKLGRFRANLDRERAERALELLNLAEGGAAYLPESDREAGLAEALEALNSAHEGWPNFYEEPPVAKRLLDLVGRYGQVPSMLCQRYVEQIVYVFLTNGYGVAWNADPIYKELIGLFDASQASYALRSFADAKISSRLQRDLPRQKWAELLELITPKLTGGDDRRLLADIQSFHGTPDQMILDSNIRRRLGLVRPPAR